MREATNINEALKLISEIREHVNQQHEQHIKHLADHGMEICGSLYVPNSTGLAVHQDDSFVRLELGPYGSGKTTTMLTEVVKRACQMPKWADGDRRRSKWAIVRNTTGELESTTLQSWLTWFGGLELIKRRQKPILNYEYRFNDGDGIVELELLFIPLDREDQIRKLKSLELTGVYLNELSEIPKSAFEHFSGRVNRYPSKTQCPETYWSGIIADTNPPDDDHWIYKDFEEKPVKGYRLFKQPPGLIKGDEGYYRNVEADNAENLPADYYEKLAMGKTEEFIKVYCMGKYGTVSDGQLVYPEYNDDFHSKPMLYANPDLPIHLGFDGGLTPACVVCQFSPRGQLMFLKEYTTERMGIRNFVENIVIPGLKMDFPNNEEIGFSVGDPAMNRADDILEELSALREITNAGIDTEAARTNNPQIRQAAIRYFLTRMIDGQPAFLISREGCPTLRKGFLRDYYFRRLRVANEERYHNEPCKNYASHPHDGAQYIALEFASDQILKERDEKHGEESNLWNPVMTL